MLFSDQSTGGERIDSVLARYSDMRRKRTTRILNRSRTTARVAQATSPLAAGLRDTALRLTLGAAMGALSRRTQVWPKPTR